MSEPFEGNTDLGLESATATATATAACATASAVTAAAVAAAVEEVSNQASDNLEFVTSAADVQPEQAAEAEESSVAAAGSAYTGDDADVNVALMPSPAASFFGSPAVIVGDTVSTPSSGSNDKMSDGFVLVQSSEYSDVNNAQNEEAAEIEEERALLMRRAIEQEPEQDQASELEQEQVLAQQGVPIVQNQSVAPQQEAGEDQRKEHEEQQHKEADPKTEEPQQAKAAAFPLFSDFVGPDRGTLVDKLSQLERKARKATGDKRSLVRNWTIQGPQGTGKTMVARRLGQFYHKQLGLLESDKVVEVKASNLSPPNQHNSEDSSKSATQILIGKLDEALGGVLIIDGFSWWIKAQSESNSVQETISALASYLDVDSKYAGRLVVVLTGSKDDFTALYTAHEQLPKLFRENLSLTAWGPQDCYNLFLHKLNHDRIQLDDDAAQPLQSAFTELTNGLGWSNAKDVCAIYDDIVDAREDDDGPVVAKDVISIVVNLAIRFTVKSPSPSPSSSATKIKSPKSSKSKSPTTSKSAAPKQRKAVPVVEKKEEEENDDDDNEEAPFYDAPEGDDADPSSASSSSPAVVKMPSKTMRKKQPEPEQVQAALSTPTTTYARAAAANIPPTPKGTGRGKRQPPPVLPSPPERLPGGGLAQPGPPPRRAEPGPPPPRSAVDSSSSSTAIPTKTDEPKASLEPYALGNAQFEHQQVNTVTEFLMLAKPSPTAPKIVVPKKSFNSSSDNISVFAVLDMLDSLHSIPTGHDYQQFIANEDVRKALIDQALTGELKIASFVNEIKGLSYHYR